MFTVLDFPSFFRGPRNKKMLSSAVFSHCLCWDCNSRVGIMPLFSCNPTALCGWATRTKVLNKCFLLVIWNSKLHNSIRGGNGIQTCFLQSPNPSWLYVTTRPLLGRCFCHTHTHTYALTHTKLTINSCLVGFTVGIWEFIFFFSSTGL